VGRVQALLSDAFRIGWDDAAPEEAAAPPAKGGKAAPPPAAPTRVVSVVGVNLSTAEVAAASSTAGDVTNSLDCLIATSASLPVVDGAVADLFSVVGEVTRSAEPVLTSDDDAPADPKAKGKAALAKGKAAAATPGTAGWKTLRGSERVPAPRDWQSVLSSLSLNPPQEWEGSMASRLPPGEVTTRGSVVLATPGPLLASVDPNSLVGLTGVACRLAVVADRWATHASVRRELRQVSTMSPEALAITAPFETAALLSLCGVGTVVLNQWSVSRASAVESTLHVLSKALSGSQSVAAVLAQRRRAVLSAPMAVHHPDTALGEASRVPVALKRRSALAPVVWGMGSVGAAKADE
jgi:hypothetical protein